MQMEVDVLIMALKSSSEKGKASDLLFVSAFMTGRGNVSLVIQGDVLRTRCQSCLSTVYAQTNSTFLQIPANLFFFFFFLSLHGLVANIKSAVYKVCLKP